MTCRRVADILSYLAMTLDCRAPRTSGFSRPHHGATFLAAFSSRSSAYPQLGRLTVRFLSGSILCPHVEHLLLVQGEADGSFLKLQVASEIYDDTISALKNDLHDKELPEGTRARRIRSSQRPNTVGNAS